MAMAIAIARYGRRVREDFLFCLNGLAVCSTEADTFVHDVVHHQVALLLDVAEDTEPVAGRHSQAGGALQVERHEDVVGVEREIRPTAEVEHHGWVRRIRHARGGETKL